MQDIEAFLAVIEAGSQTAAARRLGRSLQSVNRSLAALERGVGVELVRRTTRKSFATEAGAASIAASNGPSRKSPKPVWKPPAAGPSRPDAS